MTILYDEMDDRLMPDYESDASIFFERLRRHRSPPTTPPPDLSEQATISQGSGALMISTPMRPDSLIDSLHHELAHISDSPNAGEGTVGPVQNHRDMVDAILSAQQMMNSQLGIPSSMLQPVARPTPGPRELFTISSDMSSPWTLTMPAAAFSPVTTGPFMFNPAVTANIQQEQHVRTLPEDKATLVRMMVETTVPADNPALQDLIKLTQAFYLGYTDGLTNNSLDANESLYNTMRNVLGRWHAFVSSSSGPGKARYIMENMFRNANENVTWEKLSAIKNGTNPFVEATKAISDDIVKRFISELASLIAAKAATITDHSSVLEGGSVPHGGISFTTGDVSLSSKDGDYDIGPIAFGKFDIRISAYDFGVACGSTEFRIDEIVRIHALTPVYPSHERNGFTHPHVENHHLCFGDGLAVSANLAKAGLISDMFQYIERILMTYGSSPYIDLSEWTDMEHCSVCSSTMQPDEALSDPYSGRRLCEECIAHCDISNCDIDHRYIKHCVKCDKNFDERQFYGRIEEERRHSTRYICLECVKKEQVEALAQLAQTEASRSVDVRTTTAFPVVTPTPGRNCQSCGAALGGVKVNEDGSVVVENELAGFDPLMQATTCDHCDPDGNNLSKSVCAPGMREAYLATLLAHYVPRDYIGDIFINTEESFESEADKAEWRAIDWYQTLTTLRNNLIEHGPFHDVSFATVLENLCEFAGYNIFSELTYRLSTPRTA